MSILTSKPQNVLAGNVAWSPIWERATKWGICGRRRGERKSRRRCRNPIAASLVTDFIADLLSGDRVAADPGAVEAARERFVCSGTKRAVKECRPYAPLA